MKLPLLGYTLLALLALCYVTIRAVGVGITFDEAWTIHSYVPNSFMHILNFTPPDANNHLLNTLSIKLLFAMGSEQLWLARLPNVLAFLLYLYFSYRICSRFLQPLLGLCGFVLLVFNPFLLDFFGLARGYGMSMGFLMASLYFALAYVKDREAIQVGGVMGCGALAVLCNFSLLHYWLAAAAVVNGLAFVFRKEYPFKKTLGYSFLTAVVLCAILYEPIRKLRVANRFYYGGNHDLYTDTLTSLAKYTCYSIEATPLVVNALNVFLVVLLLVLGAALAQKPTVRSPLGLLLALTTMVMAAIISQYYLLGTLYLIDRTALFFYPLFLLSLVLGLSYLSKKTAHTIAILTTVVFGLNFLSHANFYKTALWDFDAHSNVILAKLNEKGEAENKVLTLDFSWPFRSSLDYYKVGEGYPFVEFVKSYSDREAYNPEADYYLYLGHSLEKVGYNASQQSVLWAARDTVQIWEAEQVYLLH